MWTGEILFVTVSEGFQKGGGPEEERWDLVIGCEGTSTGGELLHLASHKYHGVVAQEFADME